MMLIFDDVSGLELVRLSGALARKVADIRQEKAGPKPNPLRLITLSREVAEILRKLGVGARQTAPATSQDGPTAKHYPAEQRRTLGARQKDNDAALTLMAQIQAEGRVATEEEKAVLARFSGYGGGLMDKDGKEGSPYEYYSPVPIAAGMWGLLQEMGFTGGKVLDPSAGSGVFAATRPGHAVIDQVELSAESGGINALVNDGETCKTTISPFEAIAAATPDETYDAVVTNVPFGDAKLRLTAKLDPKLRKASLETYFILRSLDKLKPGGLAAFIVPPRVVSGTDAKMKDLRYQASLRAEFLGAYRLPNRVFQDASNADTIVDVIVLRKHGRDAKAKIDELAEQNIAALRQAQVLWEEFLAGVYFKGDGRRFQLGEFQAKDPSKLRDVDRVIGDQSTANIAKLLRKFPGSRIDWALLEAAEVAPIVCQDGDTIYHDGQTLEYREGRWLARESRPDDDAIIERAVSLQTPLAAVAAGVSWAQAGEYVSHLRDRAQALDLPDWLVSTHDALNKLPEGARPGWFEALTAGLAAIDVLREHAPSEPFNYGATFPALTARIQKVASYGRKSEAAFTPLLRDAARTLAVVYSKRGGFIARWTGDTKSEVELGLLTPQQAYERVKYERGDDFGYVRLAEIGASQGADFDLFESNDWCVSPDGHSVMRADDYYFGSYADFLKRTDAEMDAATDPKVRAKLLRQREVAASRLIVPDVERMTFNLFSPFVPAARKVEFLRDNIDARFNLEFDDQGKARIIIDIGSPKNERERQLKRFAEHLRIGTLTTRTSEADIASDPQLEAARLAQLRELVSGSNAKFNVWVKSNPGAFDEIKAKLNDSDSLYFRQVEDEALLAIPGMNTELQLHGYQCAEVRRQAKKFGGINGFDVGLGKTFTSLAAVQHVQSIGAKKKTAFVVPNSVLSNWRKEAGRAYTSLEDSLFVGLDVGTDGKATVSSGNYARDMAAILENRHRKIFMTLEAFTSIPMRQETLDTYQAYIAQVDPSFADASDKKAEEIRKAGKRDKLTDAGAKSAALPYFEDMGIDSIVIDEAHMAKNSKLLNEFQGAKYLSSASASDRGLDMQIKAWYVRGQSPNRDGVLALTATPITNSPLEIYGMLALAIGEEELNRRLKVQGADDFMNAFSEVAHLEEPDLVGRPRAGRVFLGLQNVSLLRSALEQIANIKNSDDVGTAIQVPEAEPVKIGVELDAEAKRRLSWYQTVYIAARAVVNEEALPEQISLVESFSAQTGEPVELLAHPFNLINKMSNLIMDADLEQGATRYRVGAGQAALAAKAVAQFIAKGIVEKRTRPGMLAKPENITVRKKKGGEDGATETLVKVAAWLKDDEIVIDTTDYDTQDKFLAIAAKLKLDLDVGISPKLAAFIENVRKEQATPKAAGGIAKQIVFCDMLGMHHKIKLALAKRCGIPASKIGVINAKAIKDPADMQDMQDGFNGEGEDNRYQVIIANKKAEVGINLQKGTQAIHHLTQGWTPDSLTQRNGRGVRQGNYLGRVTVYHYDANGTFDEYKRTLVGKKDDWIGAVMGRAGEADSVRIGGGLSDKEMHDLIMASGDETAMTKARAQIERRERERQMATTREAQVQVLRVIEGQQGWLKKYNSATAWRDAKINEYIDLRNQAVALGAKVERSKNEEVRARLSAQKGDVDARLAAMESLLRGASLDYRGKPDAGLGFYIEQYGRNKGAAKPTGVVNDGSPLAAKYEAERAGVQLALERARKEYAVHARKPGAYTENTLQVFESGDGAVVGGVLLVKGMIGQHKGQLWIATSPTELLHPSTRQRMAAQAVVSGFSFVGPADADEDWLPVAEQCAAIDEQTIADNTEGGFVQGDERLYSSYSPQIAERVKAVPKGVLTEPNNLALKAPQFPRPVSPGTVGGPLTKAILEQQGAILEWVEETTQWRGTRQKVRVTDISLAAPDRTMDLVAETLRYAVAHQLKISAADVEALGLYQFVHKLPQFNPAFEQGFDSALAEAVMEAKVTADLDAFGGRYVRASFPFVVFDDSLAAATVLTPLMGAKIVEAKATLAAGGKPVLWLESLLRTPKVMEAVRIHVRDTLSAMPEQLVQDGKSMVEYDPDAQAAIRRLILNEGQETGVERAYAVRSAVRDIVVAAYPGEKPSGAVLLYRGELEDIWSTMKWGGIKQVREAVKTYLAAQSAGGLNVAKVLDALNALPGITGASVLTRTIARPSSKWSGGYSYEANKTIVVGTSKGHDTAAKISSRESGLPGRHWEKGVGWLLTLDEDAKDGRGNKVASVLDLCRFLGIEVGTASARAA